MTTKDNLYYQERKDIILDIVVDEYIKSFSPVSSGLIAQSYNLSLSPATIRNILAELEEEGMLTHPHTSSGRVPTEQGYRYYVDHLMNEIQLLEDEKLRIQAEYSRQAAELEALLEKTTEVISDLTHYTTIVSVNDGDGPKLFCRGTSFVVSYPEIPDLNRIQTMLAALEEKEQLLEVINRSLGHKIEIFIGQEVECSGLEGCSLAISSYRNRQGVTGRIAVLGPTRMNYERVVSALNYISQLVSNI